MNKSGFTLVELLAVIVLLAILAGLAIPNVMTSIDNTRKNTFLLDAKRLITKAEYLQSLSKDERQTAKNEGILYDFDMLNVSREFVNDADGGSFDNETFVYVTYFDNQYQYCTCVIGSKRKITGSNENCDSKPSNIMSKNGLAPYCKLSSDVKTDVIFDK